MEPESRKIPEYGSLLLPAIYAERIKEQLSQSFIKLGPVNNSTEEEKAEAQRRAEERVAKKRRLIKAYLTIEDPIAKLHNPGSYTLSGYNECEGCDSGPYAEGYPEWPCRTADIMIDKYLGREYGTTS